MLEVAGAAFPIAPLLSQCTKIVSILQDVGKRLRRPPLPMVSIMTECSLIHVSLAHLRNLDWSSVANFAAERQEQMTRATEAITLGCTLSLSVIEEFSIELQEYVDELTPEGSDQAPSRPQVQAIWREDETRELLLQLRGYHDGLTTILRAVHDESHDDLSKVLGIHAFADILRRSRMSRSRKPLSLHAAMAHSAAYSEYSQANASQTTTPSLSVRQSELRSESSLGTAASSVSSHDRAVSPALDLTPRLEPAPALVHLPGTVYDEECNEPEQVNTHNRNLSSESSKPKRRPSRLNIRAQNRKESLYDGMHLYTKSDKDQMRKSSPTVGDTFQYIPGLPPTAADEHRYIDSLSTRPREESIVAEDEFDDLDVMEEPEGYDHASEESALPMSSGLSHSPESASEATPTVAESSRLPDASNPVATEDLFQDIPEDESEFALAKPYFAPRKPRTPQSVRDQIMTLPQNARLRKQTAGLLVRPQTPEQPSVTNEAEPVVQSESIYDFHPQSLHERLPSIGAPSQFSSSTSTQRTLPEVPNSSPAGPARQHQTDSARTSFTPPSSPCQTHFARSPSSEQTRPLIHHVSSQSLERNQPFANAFVPERNILANVTGAAHPFAPSASNRLYRSASDPRLLNFSTPNPMHLRQRSTDQISTAALPPKIVPTKTKASARDQRGSSEWPLPIVRPHDFNIPPSTGTQIQQPALLEPQYSRSFTPSDLPNRGSRVGQLSGADLYSEALQLRSRPNTLMTIESDAQGELLDEALSVTGSVAPSTMSSQWYRSPQERLGLGTRLNRNEPLPWSISSRSASPLPPADALPSLPDLPTGIVETLLSNSQGESQPEQPTVDDEPVTALPVVRTPRSPIFTEEFNNTEQVQVARLVPSARPSLEVIPEARSPRQQTSHSRLQGAIPESNVEGSNWTASKAQRFSSVRKALAEYKRGNTSMISSPQPSPASPVFPDRPATSLGVSSPATPTFPVRHIPSQAGERPLSPTPRIGEERPSTAALADFLKYSEPPMSEEDDDEPTTTTTTTTTTDDDLLQARLAAAGISKTQPTKKLTKASSRSVQNRASEELLSRRSADSSQGKISHGKARSFDAATMLDSNAFKVKEESQIQTRRSNEPLGMNLARKLSARQSQAPPNTVNPSVVPPRSRSRLSLRGDGSLVSRGRGIEKSTAPRNTASFEVSVSPAPGASAPSESGSDIAGKQSRKMSSFPRFRGLLNDLRGKSSASSSESEASRPVARRSADELRQYPSRRAGSSLGGYLQQGSNIEPSDR